MLIRNEAGPEHRIDDLPGAEVILKIVAEEATEGVAVIVSVILVLSVIPHISGLISGVSLCG